ncbi:Uncharacterized protein FWK35_00028180 [Aphis craccivora]|uniref:Uncharacterized protein n=1 Tax=Aphis craccivora TaxID=307492 RepID=A0A6G0YGH7_APHCR|nr:Uncharacterized protein FWK35_00028180 [Aphis craccivora]
MILCEYVILISMLRMDLSKKTNRTLTSFQENGYFLLIQTGYAAMPYRLKISQVDKYKTYLRRDEIAIDSELIDDYKRKYLFLNSERSEECIDFTMIITSRNNAPISNYGGGFRCKSEYPWCIIEVKS